MNKLQIKQKSDILPNMLLVITISQKCNTLISPITYQLADFPQVFIPGQQ